MKRQMKVTKGILKLISRINNLTQPWHDKTQNKTTERQTLYIH